MTDQEKKPKSKSFNSISDLLKMDGGNDIKFDIEDAQKEMEKLEERRKILTDYKDKIKEFSKLDNDNYKLQILKQLVEKGLSMLESLQHEIEDSPRGRDVETAAAMMNAINSVIDNINKIDVSKEKIQIAKDQLRIKSEQSKDINGNITQNNVYFTTTELLDIIKNGAKSIETVKTVEGQIINSEIQVDN